MTICRLPSGSYRIQFMHDKKRCGITVDHKPTQREASALIDEYKEQNKTKAAKDMTFEEAAASYIQAKYNVLSPSTRRGYLIALQRLSNDFRSARINEIDQVTIQLEVNNMAKKLSPKTVRNTHGFISAILGMYRPLLVIRTTLPQNDKKEQYIPSEDDIKRILASVKETRYYVPFVLGVLGMRRSEICAALPSDLEGNMLRIHAAKVQDENYEWHIKQTKTTESTRYIYVPDEVADRIRQDNVIYSGSDTGLWKRLDKEQKKLGIHHFRFHDLRAYYASYAHAIGIPDQYIQAAGGWKTDNVMKSVYRRTMKDEYEKTQREFLKKMKMK